MAEAQRKTFPRISPKNWWDIRRRFKASWPQRVTPGYLASVLDVGEKSAQNIIGPFRSIGLIDDDGKPTALANDWRSDDHYAEACRVIRTAAYPSELLDAFPGPTVDRKAVETWFSRAAKVGDRAARGLALFYELVTVADAAAQDSPTAQLAGSQRQTKTARAPSSPRRQSSAGESAALDTRTKVEHASDVLRISPPPRSPSLHVNVQIHISADATSDQIDQIFAGMARHFSQATE